MLVRFTPIVALLVSTCTIAAAPVADRQAIEVQGVLTVQLALTDLKLRAGNNADVIDMTTDMLAGQPGEWHALAYRGIAYARTDRQAQADADFAAADAGAGGNANARAFLCGIKAGNNVALESALADCDTALKIDPDLPAALGNRGFVLLRLGRYPESVAAFDHALAVRPNWADSLYGRGLAKRRLGKDAEAVADIAAAKAIKPQIDKQYGPYGVKD